MKYTLSIITINYNQSFELQNTINSVKNYTSNEIEYIIIDGNSNDNSVDVIKKNRNFINQWISEVDSGIYNAMNKGIDKAMGKWVIFMNSGDEFVENIEILSLLDDSYDVVYGDCIVDKGKKKRKIGKPPINLKRGMCFCHQAMFFKTKVLKENKFNEKLRISGDYDQIYRIYQQKSKFKRIDKQIAYISSGGVSDKKRIKSLIESWKICINFKDCNKICFIWSFIKEIIKIPVKKILK